MPTKPIFLLADSQLLFWRDQEGLFLNRMRDLLDPASVEPLRGAYIGASNGDRPEFYEIFVAAMGGIEIHDCRMIPSTPSADHFAFLDRADIILLAGGDVRRGWDVLKETGMYEKVIQRYYTGAVLAGVSAGAVQLGLRGWDGPETVPQETYGSYNTFQLVPFLIDVHDEPDWQRQRQILLQMGGYSRGLGIPKGGGAIYHPDRSIEPIRHSLTEFTLADDGLRRTLLFPP